VAGFKMKPTLADRHEIYGIHSTSTGLSSNLWITKS
jgi:hypothetical protein